MVNIQVTAVSERSQEVLRKILDEPIMYGGRIYAVVKAISEVPFCLVARIVDDRVTRNDDLLRSNGVVRRAVKSLVERQMKASFAKLGLAADEYRLEVDFR